MNVYVVERVGWSEDYDGWEPEVGDFTPALSPVTAIWIFFDEVKGLEPVENVYKEDGMLIVYGGGETVTLPLWYDLPEYISLRYRAVRGKTVFTCGTEEEVFNYLKGATGKELDPDTFVIDRIEYKKGYVSGYGSKFYFHYDGTEGVEAYVEIYDPRTKDEPVILHGPDEIPEQMPF